MMFFLVPGIVYGKVAGTIKNDKDVAKMMGSSLATMGGYLALAFYQNVEVQDIRVCRLHFGKDEITIASLAERRKSVV